MKLVDKRNPCPLYIQLKQALREEIAQKKIGPDEPIPDERTIASVQKVARPTISRSINELVREGLLYRVRGKGTFVGSPRTHLKKSVIGIALAGEYNNDHPYVSKVIMTLGHALNARDYAMQLFHIPDEGLSNSHSAIFSDTIKGVILANDTTLSTILTLKERNLPFVWINNDIPGEDLNCVTVDHFAGVSKGIEHLANLGHRRIAFIEGPGTVRYTPMMRQAYISTLQRFDTPYDENLIKESGWEDERSGRELAQEMMSLSNRPTALLAADDVIAIGAITGIMSMGLKVPEDMAVVGAGNFALDSISPIPLTTIDIRIEEMAKLAVDMLLDLVQGKKLSKRKIVLPPELIIRESCGAKRVLFQDD